MATSEQTDLVRTSNEMKSQIVCPLCLAIAVASKDKLGAIQSYRCAPRPNSGGWETRPQAKTDKWSLDFYKVMHGPKGETVTLSDGTTTMKGLGYDSSVKSLHFPHADGVNAKRIAIREVKAGRLRAPRNWDKVFAEEAGMTKDDLEKTYPEFYKSTSSSRSSKRDTTEEVAQPLGLFEEDEDDTSNSSHSLTIEEQDEIEAQALEQDNEFEDSYSVTAELGLDPDVEEESTTSVVDDEIHMKKPHGGVLSTVIYKAAQGFRAETEDGDFIWFYKVEDPETGQLVWLQEGQNPDLSKYTLVFED